MFPKKEQQKIKTKLHPRNKHRERYNFKLLIDSCPELTPFIQLNKYNDESVDFSNSDAVKTLNKALLSHFYGIKNWKIPNGYLCPPVPGRADYIHYVADLLAESNNGTIPTGISIKCLDIGVGANCIYPLIGVREYNWSFVGSDIDLNAIQSASKIIEENTGLKENIELRLQPNTNDIFRGTIHSNECFDLTICNPPFHSSFEEAQFGTLRKLRNLKGERNPNLKLNFGGKNSELWCDGGEKKFVQNMILQSRDFARSCLWFSTLVSKESNLKAIYSELRKVQAVEIKTIPMNQGNKKSRIVAWTYLEKEKRENFKPSRL